MADRELTPTSYIVLGLLDGDPGTPYDLKGRVAAALGHFWSIQHAQLYTETARLAEEGLLAEKRESGGRRRKTYSITKVGKTALDAWRATPTPDFGEVRDPGLLKIFLGADPKMIAAGRAPAHESRLREWEALKENMRLYDVPEGMNLALEAGLAHERVFVKFWNSLL
jgi:PadR family transcriptional regulator, regulatory protein AphA